MIRNDAEALTMALTLALTAPSDEKTQEVLRMAEPIMRRLSPEQIEDCKAKALEIVTNEMRENSYV